MATVASLNALGVTLNGNIDALAAAQTASDAETDTYYILWVATLVFLMQSGFATLAAGSITQKNVKNILLKSTLDACIGALVWYLFGYGLAYDVDDGVDGHKSNAFIGSGETNFALSGVKDLENPGGGAAHGMDYAGWQFQFAFAAAAATIVSGAVAERCKLEAYLIYSVAITAFIYPVVVHWVWDGKGFLSAGNPDSWLLGCIDFAGSGVVHMTGGWAAMVAAAILGAREGRWENPEKFQGHSTPLQVIGTFVLWFGWYGFNPGSTLTLHGNANTAARATVTTTLAAAAGGISGLIIKKHLPPKLGGSGMYDIGHVCNSLLGGLVGITAGCATVAPWAAIIIGFVSAFVYHGASCLMRKLRIDDPLDAWAVHGACGVWGVLAVGLFTVKEYSYTAKTGEEADAGIFMEGSRGKLFGIQIIAVCIEIAWVVTMSAILFGTLKVCGIFRVPPKAEETGLDVVEHGGPAYVDSGSPKGVACEYPSRLPENTENQNEKVEDLSV